MRFLSLVNATLFALSAPHGHAEPESATPADEESELFDLSLGELLDLQITSLSRKSQPVSQTAAAVFVITNDDIRRSGVTTIADALRLAPGVQVASIDGNKWAVTARGFNGLYANKLLVLVDGRSVYSQLFSGTFWDTQDTILADIDKIEVIRGPGATLWGSNAVNGVINIITRPASETRGTRLTAIAGDQERAVVSLRHGGSLGASGDYRVFAKFLERDGNELDATGDETADDWRQRRIGARADLWLTPRDRLTFQGAGYNGSSGETSTDLLLASPYRRLIEQDQTVSGFNLLGRWEHDADGDQFSIHGYVDREKREWAYIDHDRYSVDIDMDYRFQSTSRHDLVLGAGYRVISDQFGNSDRLAVIPDSRKDKLLSAFVQDDVTLVDDRWFLTAGLKLERNDYTGLEYQPSLRLRWSPDTRSSLWTSVTRGVRIPGRADRDSNALLDVIPPQAGQFPLPVALRVSGDKDFDAEVLLAYELGYKFKASSSLALDIAAYLNDYDRLRSVAPGALGCEPAGALPACLFSPATSNLVSPLHQNNALSALVTGIEVALDWRPSERWRLQANYTLQHAELRDSVSRDDAEFSFLDPDYTASVRGSFNPRSDVDVDVWLRHQDGARGSLGNIDSFTGLDLRFAWRPDSRSELALVGRNLLESSQLQFIAESGITPPTAIQRSVHLQFSLDFEL